MSSLFAELKRRRVIQMAIAYAAVGFVIAQAADIFFPGLQLPPWALTLVLALLVMGFPLAVVLAWVFDLTPAGVVRTPAAAAAAVLDAPAPVATRDEVRAAAPDPPPAAPERSVAVLPFVNVSGDPDNEYLSDGISEEILNALARLPDLRVIGRTSSFQFRGPDVDARRVGRELAVATVLAGSVQRVGDAVRITAELVDARSGVRLWSDRFDRHLEHLFVLEDDISRAILAALSVKLATGTARPLVARATMSAEAHDLYLRANALARSSDEASLQEAIRLYREAIARDPGYAAAWAGLAGVYYWLGDAYRVPREVAPIARETAARALALDPDLAAGHVLLGAIAVIWDRDFAAARQALGRALALDPGVAAVHANRGLLLLAAEGDAAGARLAFQQATSLDPLDPFLPWLEIHAALAQRRFDDALLLADRIRTLDPDFIYFMDQKAAVFLASGRCADCVSAYRALPPAVLEQPQYGLAICYAHQGETARAREILARLEAEARRRYVDATTIGTVYAALGDLDTAFDWLERAFADQSARLSFIHVLPEFAPFRSDPRYTALVRRLGVR